VDHPIHSLKQPLPWQHHIRMPLRIDAVKERVHRFAKQIHWQSRSDAIYNSIPRNPLRAEVFTPFARWNNILEHLVEVFRGKWLAQLSWMTPLDWSEFQGMVHWLIVEEFCATRSSHWTSEVKENLRIPKQERLPPLAYPDHIYWPRSEHFLFGADPGSWTLWTFHLERFTEILIAKDL
jgi:hypothetical protein